ncbi:AgrD family cyclic lactone autoinducer peptide [Clostridium sp. WILCCON 0269]|uniref:AgrD family cyclic lactone autoinducer peptide n=1 Tax=Candidatus Clostridium eludens TaxID=3381663 RepID=A0ABW8SMF5_9CLOT
MKNKKTNFIISLCTLMLLSFANIITYSGSLFLHGEPKPPKSLLK